MTSEVEFNYGTSDNVTSVTKLIIDESPDDRPKGCRNVILDILPPTMTAVEFERFQINRFHESLLVDVTAFTDAIKNTPNIAQLQEFTDFIEAVDKCRDVNGVLRGVFDGMTEAEVIDKFVQEHLIWCRVHGIAKDKSAAEALIGVLSKKNTLHSFNTTNVGRWTALHAFKMDTDGKKNFSYIDNPVLDKFFASRSTKLHAQSELNTSLKDAPMSNELDMKVSEFNRVIDPSEWDDLADRLEKGEKPDGLIEKPSLDEELYTCLV